MLLDHLTIYCNLQAIWPDKLIMYFKHYQHKDYKLQAIKLTIFCNREQSVAYQA